MSTPETRNHRLAAAHIGVAIAAFGIASAMGVVQGLSVADVDFPQRSESLYYMSVTAHGVLMALVFTTFFIMGLGYAFSQAALDRIVGRRTAWFGFWLALTGSTATAYTILTGQASVLYTFYPPLQAHPLFYIGATMLVVGSWIWGGVMIASIRAWKRDHPGQALPLVMRILLAMVKDQEDRANLERDTGRMGVPAILVVEDSIRYYSSFLPVIYSELMLHSQQLITEGLNLSQRLLRMRARRIRDAATDPVFIYIALQEIKIDDLADTLEEVHQGLEEVSRMVLETQDRKLEEAIDELTRHEDLNGKVRLCLMDTQRDLTFLLRYGQLSQERAEQARELLRDINSLLPHNDFLFQKVNFLMSAAQGFISMEQNQIIKIFSIAAVVFLPPTLLASIYGMNFRVMPELGWPFGYPLALVLMVLAGIAPYWYFKRRGWL